MTQTKLIEMLEQGEKLNGKKKNETTEAKAEPNYNNCTGSRS